MEFIKKNNTEVHPLTFDPNFQGVGSKEPNIFKTFCAVWSRLYFKS